MKKNLNKFVGLAILAMSLSQAIQASEGTGVGNGGNSARDQYLQKMQQEMKVRGNSGMLEAWCSRVFAVLERELQRARLQVQFNRHVEAKQILIDALTTASVSLNYDQQASAPMTKKLIDRSLNYIQAMDHSLSADRMTLMTELNYLMKSVGNILRVSRELDIPYYIPYHHQYGSCGYGRCPPQFDLSEFQKRVVRMAADQLSFVTAALVETAYRGGVLETFPVGSPKAFLTIAELVASDVAEDLSGNLHAFKNACSIQELEGLNETLSAYNHFGDRSIYPTERWAISQVREDLDRIASDIRANMSQCASGPHPFPGPYFNQ